MESSGTELAVVIEAPAVAVVGLPVLMTIKVINRGKSELSVSSRLNLMEGDVRIVVTGPDGTKRVVSGAGGQPDTALRRVTLAPGQQIVGAMNLLYTSVGVTFPTPGKYVLQAEYAPSPRMDSISSEPVSLTVRSPENEEERSAVVLLESEEAKRALTMAQADTAPDQIRELAARVPDTLAGKLARLLLGDSGSILQDTDPMSTASLIKSLSTPFSNVGKRLAEGFAEHVKSQDATPKLERALRIAQDQPVESD